MKKIFTYIIIVLAFTQHGCAQQPVRPDSTDVARPRGDSVFSYVYFIPGNYINMEVDNLDNIYLLTSGYQLKKYAGNGDSVGVFNDVKRYGNPSYVDVSNPFKILVFYKNFSTAVVLDRQLTLRNTLNFRKHGIFNVKAVTSSYDNNIWLFDEQDFKLKKIDDEGKTLLESTDLRMLINEVPSPQTIFDKEDNVYLYDTARGFYIFDYYGALKNNLPLLNWRSVSASEKTLYGFDSTALYSYALSSLQLKRHPLSSFFKGYLSIKAMNRKVYMLSEAGVYIYNIK